MNSLARLRQDSSKKRSTMSVVAIAGAALLALSACGGGSTEPAASSAAAAPAASAAAPAAASGIAADQWVSNVGEFKDAANWDVAEVLTLDLAAAMTPASIDLVAGMPYEIQITNSGAADQGVSAPDLFRASAVRKTESGAEVKMFQFTDVFAAAGKTVSLFLIPVVPGTYPLAGVGADGAAVAGLTGTVNVTGAHPTAPVPAIEPLTSLGAPAGGADLIAAAIPTWDAAATAVTITMGDTEGASGFYKPADTALKVGVPATITFVNEGTVVHVYECEDFLKTAATWKVTGSEGWNTGAQVRPADVEAGVTTSLYVIPTVAGSYTLTDSSPGMEAISATITVTE